METPSPTEPRREPPSAKARVTPPGAAAPPPSAQATSRLATSPLEPAGRGGRVRRALLTGGLLLFALALVGAGTWWMLDRRGRDAPAGSSDPIPPNPVLVINSGTPVPARYSSITLNDTARDLVFAPESGGEGDDLKTAFRALDEGRYTEAISQFSALSSSDDRPKAHNALWGLAESYEAAGQFELAARAYSLFTFLREDPRAARSYFRLAHLDGVTLRWLDVGWAYEEYAKFSGPARNAVRLIRAQWLGTTPDAIALYRQVLSAQPLDPDRRDAQRRLGEVLAALDRHKEALETFDALAKEQDASPRPLLDNTGDPPHVLAAQEEVALGKSDAARARLLAYIRGSSTYAYGRQAAVDALVKIDPAALTDGTLSPLDAARIAYAAGYSGRAVSALEQLRQPGADPGAQAEAFLLTGKAFDMSGDPASAFAWYTRTLETYPASPQASEASRRAGDSLAGQAAWDSALTVYTQTVAAYPTGPEAALARLHGGVLAYRLQNGPVASDLLAPLVAASEVSPSVRTQAAFWLGKVQKSAGDPAWRATLKTVSEQRAGGFLGFRADSVLGGEPDGGPGTPTFTETNVTAEKLAANFDGEAAERMDLLTWASTLPGSRHAAASPTPAAEIAKVVTQNPKDRLEAERAALLMQAGAKREANEGFRALAAKLADEGDTQGLASLVIYLRYNADTRTAMEVAEVLADLNKDGNPLSRPSLLLKTLYPAPYSDLVLEEARTRGIDPLLVYALIRQESQFVPDARSGANAIGLTQVIPSTGQGIAEQLGDDNFSSADLTRPVVSIRYGTYYLASNLPQFDRKLLPTLAAYNGGPGNAARWLQGSALFDPDLFAERIDLFETEDYLRRVYENYGYYRALYAK